MCAESQYFLGRFLLLTPGQYANSEGYALIGVFWNAWNWHSIQAVLLFYPPLLVAVVVSLYRRLALFHHLPYLTDCHSFTFLVFP